MRNLEKLFPALILFFVLNIGSGSIRAEAGHNLFTASQFDQKNDSLIEQALAVFQSHMENLKNLREKGGEFKAKFRSSVQSLPCEYCEKHKLKTVDNYTFELKERFPEGPPFRYEISDLKKIEVLTYTKNQYRVDIPVEIIFTKLLTEEGEIIEKTRSSQVKYSVFLDYTKNEFSIQNVEAMRAEGSNLLMLEFSPNMRVSGSEYTGLLATSDYSTGAFMGKIGISYYFYPFKGLNKSDIWLKAGLRLGYNSSSFDLDQVTYSDSEIALSGMEEGYLNFIDIERNISAVNEKQNSLFLEIPIGISKRFGLSSKTDLSIELEGSYNIEIAETINGDYSRDQLGKNHYLINGYQRASGGERLVYNSSPQAVTTAETDERIDFYTNRIGLLDNNETETSGYFVLSLRPTLLIRKYEEIKFQIGLNASMAFLSSTEKTQIDQEYFDPETNSVLPSIIESDENTNPIYIGLVFGIIL